jgi:hypothetical protein
MPAVQGEIQAGNPPAAANLNLYSAFSPLSLCSARACRREIFAAIINRRYEGIHIIHPS